MHVDDIGLRIEVIVPDILQQHRSGDHLVGMAHQIFEQLELARLQRDLPGAPAHLARHRIHMQVADGQRDLMVHAVRPPVQSVQARQQFAEGKRLGEVIVAAAAQAADAVVDLGQRAQYHDGRALAGLAQHLDDGQTIDVAGQHSVHDDDVIGFAGGEEHAVPAVVGVVGGMSGFLQALDDELADPFVVLDQQNFHVASPAGAGAWAARSCSGILPRRRLSHRLN